MRGFGVVRWFLLCAASVCGLVALVTAAGVFAVLALGAVALDVVLGLLEP